MSKQDVALEKAFESWKDGEISDRDLTKAFLEWEEMNRKQGQMNKLYQNYRTNGRVK